MNSQNRMNAGAEYVLYRIWAALQESEGIHAESLFTCLGALSGYACQVYARRAGARASVNLPLTESPLSVWALVRRSVQKLGAPLPDIGEILARGTRDEQRHPRHHAIFYLRQIWPQILPIAQRFCRKPTQLPVLFGIALQRAIEHTTELMSPTLSASIAMECAVAMSRVELPELAASVAREPAPAPESVFSANKPRAAKTLRGARRDALAASSSSGRIPMAKTFATIASFALIAIGSAMWKANPPDAPIATPRVERQLRVSAFQRNDSRPLAQPIEAPSLPSSSPRPETPPRQSAPPPTDEPDFPAAPPEQPANEGIITDEP